MLPCSTIQNSHLPPLKYPSHQLNLNVLKYPWKQRLPIIPQTIVISLHYNLNIKRLTLVKNSKIICEQKNQIITIYPFYPIISSLSMEDQSSSSSSSETSKTAALDFPLHTIGFEIEELSPHRVSGRLPVTHKCCQVCSFSSFLINKKLFYFTHKSQVFELYKNNKQ